MGGHLLSSFVTKSISIVLAFFITTKQRNKFVGITKSISVEPPHKPEDEDEDPEVDKVAPQENLR
jgi:hypothetical protein